MVLTTQVRAKLFRESKEGTPSALFRCTGAMESDFSHEGAIQTRSKTHWETISPFRRLVPERVPDRAFCLMELVLLGLAA